MVVRSVVKYHTSLLLVVLVALLSGCGDGPQESDVVSTVRINVRWEQPDGDFSAQVPEVVQRVRVVVTPENGDACCVSLAPESGGSATLNDLPLGEAGIQITGFAREEVPPVAGISRQCPTEAGSDAAPCQGDASAFTWYQGGKEDTVIVEDGNVQIFARLRAIPTRLAKP